MCRKDRIGGIQFYTLDMEWSERNGYVQPLELGVVPVDTVIKPFFSLIRPEDETSLRQEIFSFLRKKKAALRAAPVFSDVISELKRYRISGNDEKRIAIVWHENTARYFIVACRRAGVKVPFDRLVCLKNLMWGEVRIKGGESSFEAFLKEYNIPFDAAKFHDSAYDVECLKKLFMKYRIGNENIQIDQPLVINKNSGIIHKNNCFHVMKKGYSFKSFVMEDLYSSSGFCRYCCKGTAPWIKPLSEDERKLIKLKYKFRQLAKDRQLKEAAVASMCVLFGFEYTYSTGCIYIKTVCGRWRIIHDGKEIRKVEHGNHRGDEQRPGFHTHRQLKGDLYNVLDYISRHDNAIVSRENRKSLKRTPNSIWQCKKVVHHSKRNYYTEKDEWEEYYEEERRR